MKFKQIIFPAILVSLMICASGPLLAAKLDGAGAERRLRTYANPIDLPYRYQPFTTPFREAADPTIVTFKGRYWLFASHSKGYWHSTDLIHWTFVGATGYDVDKYAPTVLVKNDKLYLAVGQNAKKLWITDDPMTGTWREAADISPGYLDPCLFLDDDGHLYMYEGLSGTNVLRVVELDPQTFQPVRSAPIPQTRDKESRGWEVVGDHNERYADPSYIEGAWMTKYRGKYYLQYAAPGTQFKTYADGVLVADSPMGPFRYQADNPFSLKSTGFISGAGHGSTFQGFDGLWWHTATMAISRRFMFERRIGLFPTRFTEAGDMVTDTYLADYPHYVTGDRGLTGWMLLSRHKAVTASSSLEGFAPELAVDENVRTWWSAQTGDAREWLQIDLGASKRIEALQINFADQDSKGRGISGDVYKYVIDASQDGKNWQAIIDMSESGRDAPHDFEVLPRPKKARFIRIRNIHSPDEGKFSLYDLRVFGKGNVPAPGRVIVASGARDAADKRKAVISWQPTRNTDFYVVRLGIRPDQLTQSYQVYDGQASLSLASLNDNTEYFFVVDAINEGGVVKGTVISSIK